MELKEKQEQLIRLFSRAPIKKTMGMVLSYKKESAVFTMPYNPDFDHALGQVHGGVIATLIDNAGWFTAAQYYDTWMSTAELQVRLLEPAEQKQLFATGSIIKTGKRFAMVSMEVKSESGLLVAVGSGTFVATSVKFEVS